jgi:hypothetical protein
MAAKKAVAKKAAPKSMGSDRGAMTKAKEAERKVAAKKVQQAQTASYFYNQTPAQKAASRSSSVSTRGEYVVGMKMTPSYTGVMPSKGAIAMRRRDQLGRGKEIVATRKAANAKRVAKGKK